MCIRDRAWVEEVIGQRLPGGDFAAAFKDGRGLCMLVNVFQPGTISKVETSTSPFKQMANISAFIQACRTLGVREHALFETLVSVCCLKPRSQRAKVDTQRSQPAIKPAIYPARYVFKYICFHTYFQFFATAAAAAACCMQAGMMTY